MADRAAARVAEFLAATDENPDAGNLVATARYHDGMGMGLAVLLLSDLRALLDEREQLRARRTTGGPPAPITKGWESGPSSSPPSATDGSAPPMGRPSNARLEAEHG
jgi:hypothetical protein